MDISNESMGEDIIIENFSNSSDVKCNSLSSKALTSRNGFQKINCKFSDTQSSSSSVLLKNSTDVESPVLIKEPYIIDISNEFMGEDIIIECQSNTMLPNLSAKNINVFPILDSLSTDRTNRDIVDAKSCDDQKLASSGSKKRLAECLDDDIFTDSEKPDFAAEYDAISRMCSSFIQSNKRIKIDPVADVPASLISGKQKPVFSTHVNDVESNTPQFVNENASIKIDSTVQEENRNRFTAKYKNQYFKHNFPRQSSFHHMNRNKSKVYTRIESGPPYSVLKEVRSRLIHAKTTIGGTWDSSALEEYPVFHSEAECYCRILRATLSQKLSNYPISSHVTIVKNNFDKCDVLAGLIQCESKVSQMPCRTDYIRQKMTASELMPSNFNAEWESGSAGGGYSLGNGINSFDSCVSSETDKLMGIISNSCGSLLPSQNLLVGMLQNNYNCSAIKTTTLTTSADTSTPISEMKNSINSDLLPLSNEYGVTYELSANKSQTCHHISKVLDAVNLPVTTLRRIVDTVKCLRSEDEGCDTGQFLKNKAVFEYNHTENCTALQMNIEENTVMKDVYGCSLHSVPEPGDKISREIEQENSTDQFTNNKSIYSMWSNEINDDSCGTNEEFSISKKINNSSSSLPEPGEKVSEQTKHKNSNDKYIDDDPNYSKYTNEKSAKDPLIPQLNLPKDKFNCLYGNRVVNRGTFLTETGTSCCLKTKKMLEHADIFTEKFYSTIELPEINMQSTITENQSAVIPLALSCKKIAMWNKSLGYCVDASPVDSICTVSSEFIKTDSELSEVISCLVPDTLKDLIGKKAITTDKVQLLMLEWSVGWLTQKKREYSPYPIPNVLRIVTNTYSNFEDYYNTYFPLMLHETWHRIYESWIQLKKHEPLPCQITEYFKVTNYVNVQCEAVYIDENFGGPRPEKGSILVVTYRTKLNNGCISAFGYVTFAAEEFCSIDDDTNMSVCRNLTLEFRVVHDLKDIDTEQLVHINVLCNVKHNMKQNDAILYVKRSPFQRIIFEPSAHGFQKFFLDSSCFKETHKKCIDDITSHFQFHPTQPSLSVVTFRSGKGRPYFISLLIQQLVNVSEKVLICAKDSEGLCDIASNICLQTSIKFVIILSSQCVKPQFTNCVLSNLVKGELEKMKEEEAEKTPSSSQAIQKILMDHKILLTLTRNSRCGTLSKFFQETGMAEKICCVLDDASSCTEPETLLPLTNGITKLILVGNCDGKPKVLSKTAKQHSYHISLLHRACILSLH